MSCASVTLPNPCTSASVSKIAAPLGQLRAALPKEHDSRELEPREWLLDSGSAVDLVQENSLPDHVRAQIEDTDRPIVLNFANGATVADSVIGMQIDYVAEIYGHSS